MIATDDDKYLQGLQKLSDSINNNGSVAVMELSNEGRYCHSGLTGMQHVAPSPLPGFNGRGEMPRELTTEEVEELVKKFGDSARLCAEAGYKGVAVGMEPNIKLLNTLKEKLPNIHSIGDCSQARRMLEAIHEGIAIGKKL